MKENAMRRAALVGGMYQLLRGRFDSWFESDPEPSSEETTLPDELMSFVKSSQLRSYKSILDASRQMVTNPNLSLVFIHWPTPHAPGIYDRVWNKFSLESGATYFDNMELVDRTLGEVRRDMQQAGVWDQATVLITSDHSLRTKLWQSFPGWTAESRAVAGVEQDPRVPFLLKLQGQKTGVTLDQPFSNVIIHDLVLALLRRQLPNPAAIASWLQAETGRASALQAGDLSSTDQRSQAERSKSTRQPARAEVTLLKNGE
jgi:arylsulfatase A-like enzyme